MDIEIPSLILINSPQGGGKSHLIRYIMYQHRKKFDYGIVFTNTYFEDDSFDYVPKDYVHPEFDEEILSNLMTIQQNLIKKNIIKEAFVIFDDCIDRTQFESSILKRVCTQLRHYHITVIFSTQYANLLPTYMRTNCMSVIIFKTDSECNLKALYQSYGQMFDSFNAFKNFILSKLGNHKFIYYKKNQVSEDINETFPVMIAPERIPKFKLKFNN